MNPIRRLRLPRIGALLLTACALVGCVGPPPKVLKEGGIKISDLGLTSERLAQGSWRIFEIRPMGEELLVVTSEGAVVFEHSGKAVRSVVFTPEGVARTPVTSGDVDGQGRPAYVAHVRGEGGSDLVFFRRDGTPYVSVPHEFKYSEAVVIADVVGDGRHEVVGASGGEERIYIYDGEGNPLPSPDPSYRASLLQTLDLFGDDKEEMIFYDYKTQELGGWFYVFDGGGRKLNEWKYGVTSGFDAVRRDGEPVLVINRDDFYHLVDPEGQELAALKAPYLEHFAEVHAAPWRNGWVIVGSGSGYRPYHVISVFDEAGELVYHELGKGWSESMAVPDEDGREFFVAKGGELWRYSLP